MGSQVLKLLPTTWNFWLLSPSSSSELLLPSQAMVIMAVVTMEVTMEDTMVATEDTTTARDPLMLSPDMATTAMEVTMEDTVGATMATVATEDTTTARGLPMLSPDMVTTVMGTEATV